MCATLWKSQERHKWYRIQRNKKALYYFPDNADKTRHLIEYCFYNGNMTCRCEGLISGITKNQNQEITSICVSPVYCSFVDKYGNVVAGIEHHVNLQINKDDPFYRDLVVGHVIVFQAAAEKYKSRLSKKQREAGMKRHSKYGLRIVKNVKICSIRENNGFGESRERRKAISEVKKYVKQEEKYYYYIDKRKGAVLTNEEAENLMEKHFYKFSLFDLCIANIKAWSVWQWLHKLYSRPTNTLSV